MTTRVDAFVCDFCVRKKRFASKVGAARHEKQCFHNPSRRACVTCRHLTIERYNHEDGSGGASCEFGLIPIPAGPETPARALTFDCEKWEQKAAEVPA